MGKKIEMVGKRFGRLTVVAESDKRDRSGSVFYRCLCDCGNEKSINGINLRKGVTRSCGCYNREVITKDNPVYKTKLYNIYSSMKGRCNNPNDRSYHNYGGRGISVCKEWNTFEAFQKWALGNGYSESLWIDRIDNDKGYSPDNCRWSTPKEQQNNKRTCRYITIDGVTKSLTMWAEEAGINPSTLKRRIELGWEKEDLFKPVDKSRSHSEAIKQFYIKTKEN